MMVESKDNLPAGTKTGVVAPVPINTPSLRQEIHGSQGETSGIAAIGRSSGSGWGSVSSSSPVGGVDRVSQAGHRSKGRGVGGGDAGSGGGDDVFTRNFPDLRAGLEQAEKLDAVTKASSKVAPLRKPKPEPVKDQGPSLRPRGMVSLPRHCTTYSYVLKFLVKAPFFYVNTTNQFSYLGLRYATCASRGHP